MKIKKKAINKKDEKGKFLLLNVDINFVKSSLHAPKLGLGYLEVKNNIIKIQKGEVVFFRDFDGRFEYKNEEVYDLSDDVLFTKIYQGKGKWKKISNWNKLFQEV